MRLVSKRLTCTVHGAPVLQEFDDGLGGGIRLGHDTVSDARRLTATVCVAGRAQPSTTFAFLRVLDGELCWPTGRGDDSLPQSASAALATPAAGTNIAAVTVHLVGGFLGSGKTTAIRSACELLRQRGEAVSVITNDQGTLLVDTAFLRGSHPTREVTGGCFCCRYDQLVELLAEARRDGAKHVFAEAVGSCADLVATVVRPLLGSPAGPVDRVSFTAMVDARLLMRLQAGEPLPWSGDVAYLFLEQLRAAPLLVASKWDLVSDGLGILAPGQTVLIILRPRTPSALRPAAGSAPESAGRPGRAGRHGRSRARRPGSRAGRPRAHGSRGLEEQPRRHRSIRLPVGRLV